MPPQGDEGEKVIEIRSFGGYGREGVRQSQALARRAREVAGDAEARDKWKASGMALPLSWPSGRLCRLCPVQHNQIFPHILELRLGCAFVSFVICWVVTGRCWAGIPMRERIIKLYQRAEVEPEGSETTS